MMVDISLNDKTIIMKFDDKKEEKNVKDFITYDDNKNAFRGGRFNPMFVKSVCLGKIVQECLVCFAGLTKEILIFLRDNSIKINSFKDKRTHFDFQKKEYSHDELRKFFNPKFEYVEHQIRALQAMLKTNTGIINAITSSGKSSIMTAYAVLTNMRILVIVDKATLASQLSRTFKDAGIDCGLVCGGSNVSGYCVVSTIQSIKKINLMDFDCVMVDECHHASSNSFQELLESISYPYKFGFSASPDNGDKYSYAKIRQFIGSTIVKIGSEELMEHGVITKPDIVFVKSFADDTMDYPSAYDLGIVHNDRRNKSILNIVNEYKDGVMILVKSLEHGEELQSKIPDSVYLKGEDTLDRRNEVIAKFEKGEIKVLIGSTILNEGISINRILCLIIASGNKAITQSIQKIGRALRLHKDKKEAYVYDFYDEPNKFLLKHSKARMRIYKNEGFKIAKIVDEDLREIT